MIEKKIIDDLKSFYDNVKRYNEISSNLNQSYDLAKNDVDEVKTNYLKERKNHVKSKILNNGASMPKCPSVLTAGISHDNDKDSYCVEDHQEQLNNFIKQCIQFDKAFSENLDSYIDKADEINEKYIQSKKEAISKNDNFILETENEYKCISNEIADKNIISEKYYSLLPSIIEILEDMRADNLTNALNLAIAEQRDKEFKLEQLMYEERKLREIKHQTKLAEEQDEREREKERRLNELRRW